MFAACALFFLLSHVAFIARANTEIVNFSGVEATDGTSVPLLAAQWPALNQSSNELQWNIIPAPLGTPLKLVCQPNRNLRLEVNGSSLPWKQCPHELWIALDLMQGGWDTYKKFTVRLSWPASYPSDFSIDIYDPEDLAAHFATVQVQWLAARVRRKYARIRIVDIGIPTPTPESKAATSKSVAPEPIPVPIIVVLEPLYFGVLPASVTPVLGFIIFVCALAGLAVPRINRYLQKIATQARQDILKASDTRKHD